jgi:hypothetical protein
MLEQQAFDRLKALLLSAPVLALPNKTDYYILDTDASDKAIGAELIQVQNGEERVIAYGSFMQIVLKLSSKAYNSQQLLSSCTISALLWCKNETTIRDDAFFAILHLD